MKKITVIFLTLLSFCAAQAFEIPQDADKYLQKSQVGMPYWQALEQKKPFLLVFANSNNIFAAVKFIPIAEMVYNEFKNDYNFCILNTRDEENKEFAKLFGEEKEPTLYIIDTQAKTYTYVDSKYYNKKKLRKILEAYKNGTPE